MRGNNSYQRKKHSKVRKKKKAIRQANHFSLLTCKYSRYSSVQKKLLIKIPYEDNQQKQVIVRIIQISQAIKKTLPPKIKIHEIFHILTQIKKTTKQLKKILHQRFKK